MSRAHACASSTVTDVRCLWHVFAFGRNDPGRESASRRLLDVMPMEVLWRELVLMGITFRIRVPRTKHVPDEICESHQEMEKRATTRSKTVFHVICSWVSLFFVVKVRHTYPAHHISSISPLSTPSLTSRHLNTQTSPRFSSTVPAPCSPCTSTCPASLNIRQKTALSSSGLSIMLIPPAVSSSFRKPAGKEERNAVL